ncbi:ATP-binding protein [Spiroplasma platyhelix]|uniref:ATP-binding protein n=1 Tax=Spiroplasma platyhelix PALS-1 TaxID=1276218 RepID=A0A846TW97_9MOLU|nr:ATP-binding protein [Spiroplasma platyhelix]MBE4704072.1 Primosomal protein DnaI [Spiroplasma platyhelix PALS-1]NKE38442.1 ATP-binding protein [Spiroplasma platyhelix PALS-1]UJB29330.1 primosomal protein DnaI [Spiroplasma platyhelix PALS-1]
MKSNLEQFLKENEGNKELINFIADNKINDQLFIEYYDLFQEYVTSCNLCKKNENIVKCQQKIQGYRLKLNINTNQKVISFLTECSHTISNLKQKELNDKFLIRHYDDALLSLSWSKEFITAGRGRQEVISYLKTFQLKTSAQGLYLYGDTGVGKTYIFILLANKLIQKKHTVSFISWPQFVTEFKSNFENKNDNIKKLEQIKNCDFLFIDDLGSESISPWERDELLFSILNARVLPLKTTFISSSYNLSDLARCYRPQANKIEDTKVKRLIERIKKLTKPIELTDFKN